MADAPGIGAQEMSVPQHQANMLVSTSYNTLEVAVQSELNVSVVDNTIDVPIDEPEAKA